MPTTEVRGTCHHDCPDSCGWVATVTDGIAVKLRGDEEHPYSQGELCPKVNRFIQRVYHPDRILTPKIRTGAKGAGEFRDATWDEALALVAEQWHSIIDDVGGEAILPWHDAGTQGLLQESSLDRRLFARLGASRQIGSLCGATAGWGTFATNGSPHGADPLTMEHSKLIILWGTNTLVTNRHLWPWIEKARARGARLVVIDPYRTVTADRADTFIAPRPGTDVAVMLAMMHVLIRDDLLDHDYIEQYTNGFSELAAHVADCSPEFAARESGLDASVIEDLAKAWGTTTPAMIRTLVGPEHRANGGSFFRTLACLPLLTGAWRHRGGGLARSVHSITNDDWDFGSFDATHLSPTEHRRSYNMNHLGRHLTDPDLDPPVRSVVVWNGNPVTSVPGAAQLRVGLERPDVFTVVSEQFMTDTARYADVIFPATTQLEHDDVVTTWGHLYTGWNNAAIEPLGETVPNTELWRRLANAMGYTEPELFVSDEELLQAAARNVDLAALRRDGTHHASVGPEWLPYANGGFGFPDGRARFVNNDLAAEGVDPLPTWVPPAESATTDPRYPLSLHTPKSHMRFLNTSYSALEGHGDRESGPFVDLSESDAAARGIADGDRCVVHNDRGSMEITARLSGRVQTGQVAVPFGWWDQHFGPDDTNVNDLTNDELTDFGGGVAYSDTAVEVSVLARADSATNA